MIQPLSRYVVIIVSDTARRERIEAAFNASPVEGLVPYCIPLEQAARGGIEERLTAAALIDFEPDPQLALAAAFHLRRSHPRLAIAALAPSPGYPIPVEALDLGLGPLVTDDDDSLAEFPQVALSMADGEGDDTTTNRELRLRHQELRDITDSLARQSVHLIRLRNELASEKKKFETVVNGAADGLAFYDTDRQLELVNPVARDLFFDLGDQPAMRLEELDEQLRPLRTEDRKEEENLFEIRLAGRSMRVQIITVTDSDAHPAGTLVSFVDVTRDREYERLKTDFTNMISHELRTPLTSIRAAVDNFLRGNLGEVSEKQRTFLELMARNVDRQQALIDDLLDLAKLEAGQMELCCETTDLARVVVQGVEQFTLAYRDKEIDLIVNAPAPIMAPVDPSLIHQALANLLSNALKFTEKGGSVTVGLSSDGTTATLWVEDDGIGIPPEKQATIFDKYTQADSGQRRRYPGTGLGLAIVRQIARTHGGEVIVRSAPGEGSRFTMTIPLNEETR